MSTKVVSNIRSAAKFRQTVVVIDDQPTVLNIHKAILQSLSVNLNIVTMTNPIDALAWMKNKQIDLIVTDFSMLQMDGMRLVQTINKANNVSHTPIIVITVLKDQNLHEELIAAGADACLTKPANANDLINMAQFLLKPKRRRYNNHNSAALT